MSPRKPTLRFPERRHLHGPQGPGWLARMDRLVPELAGIPAEELGELWEYG